jgi:hypothetical protein
VRDDLRQVVVDRFGDPDGVLVVGRHSLLIRRNNTTGELAFHRY